jgi:hypothetical protein
VERTIEEGHLLDVVLAALEAVAGSPAALQLRYIISIINLAEIETTLRNDRNEVIIDKDDFQKLFRIGYAFTAHSCQGMTINEPNTIHDFDRMHKKLKYVAPRRATHTKNII